VHQCVFPVANCKLSIETNSKQLRHKLVLQTTDLILYTLFFWIFIHNVGMFLVLVGKLMLDCFWSLCLLHCHVLFFFCSLSHQSSFTKGYGSIKISGEISNSYMKEKLLHNAMASKIGLFPRIFPVQPVSCWCPSSSYHWSKRSSLEYMKVTKWWIFKWFKV